MEKDFELISSFSFNLDIKFNSIWRWFSKVKNIYEELKYYIERGWNSTIYEEVLNLKIKLLANTYFRVFNIYLIRSTSILNCVFISLFGIEDFFSLQFVPLEKMKPSECQTTKKKDDLMNNSKRHFQLFLFRFYLSFSVSARRHRDSFLILWMQKEGETEKVAVSVFLWSLY